MGKRVLAIDPGPKRSAWIVWDGTRIFHAEIDLNENLLFLLDNKHCQADYMVIEQIKSYGMTVSDSIFDTVFWSGRFCQAWNKWGPWERIPRMTVKMHLCHNSRAKDSNIRTALIDRFGGKEKAIGKKVNPGICYGIKADMWSSLALGITWLDKNKD